MDLLGGVKKFFTGSGRRRAVKPEEAEEQVEHPDQDMAAKLLMGDEPVADAKPADEKAEAPVEEAPTKDGPTKDSPSDDAVRTTAEPCEPGPDTHYGRLVAVERGLNEIRSLLEGVDKKIAGCNGVSDEDRKLIAEATANLRETAKFVKNAKDFFDRVDTVQSAVEGFTAAQGDISDRLAAVNKRLDKFFRAYGWCE